MQFESLLGFLFYLLPGFLCLTVYDWFVGRIPRSGIETTAWSVGLSLVAALPLLSLDGTREFLEYLWDPSALSPRYLIGIGLQTTSALILGYAWGILVTGPLEGRFGSRSFYQRGWDWMWSRSTGQRKILVRTEKKAFWGTLAVADNPLYGQDIVLQNPATWEESVQRYRYTGMKYALIPGDRVVAVETSVSAPPVDSDRPLPRFGYVDEDPRAEGNHHVG